MVMCCWWPWQKATSQNVLSVCLTSYFQTLTETLHRVYFLLISVTHRNLFLQKKEFTLFSSSCPINTWTKTTTAAVCTSTAPLSQTPKLRDNKQSISRTVKQANQSVHQLVSQTFRPLETAQLGLHITSRSNSEFAMCKYIQTETWLSQHHLVKIIKGN